MAEGSPGHVRKLLAGAYPMGLVGVLYAAMRTVRNVGVSQGTVHLCDLRAREVALFGVSMNGVRVTPNDWWQAHPSRALDALCALPYATFFIACFGCAAWLYGRDYARMVRFAWCFLALNVVGFVTYHLYPAAPPWYFHAHGCAVDTSVTPSEGPGLARFDAWIGIPYFARMYSGSSAVFGAIPSLHVAYALLVVLEGWSLFSAAWRVASAAFFGLMCFAAVYLDHHWVEDVIAGAACSLAVVGAMRAVASLRPSQAP
jgi:membrane-associated phospholipid phosphatase